jgi:hypothetical protein
MRPCERAGHLAGPIIPVFYMRNAIETAPKDGEVVILEDDASGIYDVAHWSAEAAEWVGENGKPSKVAPTHWHPIPRVKFLLQQDDESGNPSQGAPATVDQSELQTAPVEANGGPRARPRSKASWKNATLITATFIGLYFYVTRDAQQPVVRISTTTGQVVGPERQLPSRDPWNTDRLALQQYPVADQASAHASTQLGQVREASASEARQSLERDPRLEALGNELAEARRAIEARDNEIDARDRQLRELESDLAMVGREVQTNTALLTELQQERDRAETLSLETAMARESAKREVDALTTSKAAANSRPPQVTQTVAAAEPGQPAAAVSLGAHREVGKSSFSGTQVGSMMSPDGLMERASALLDEAAGVMALVMVAPRSTAALEKKQTTAQVHRPIRRAAASHGSALRKRS